LQLLAFADDTTQLSRKSLQETLERLLTDTLAEWGETVHTGKTARMEVGREVQAAGDGWVTAIEFLGGWLEADGSTRKDTYVRIEAARKLWFAVYRRLPHLDLDLKLQGQVIRATVLASL
jgi:hypothetical protein